MTTRAANMVTSRAQDNNSVALALVKLVARKMAYAQRSRDLSVAHQRSNVASASRRTRRHSRLLGQSRSDGGAAVADGGRMAGVNVSSAAQNQGEGSNGISRSYNGSYRAQKRALTAVRHRAYRAARAGVVSICARAHRHSAAPAGVTAAHSARAIKIAYRARRCMPCA